MRHPKMPHAWSPPEHWPDHHITPQAWQPGLRFGPGEREVHLPLPETVHITADQHLAVHAFIDLLVKYHGDVPGSEAKHFGPYVKMLARLGYDRAIEFGLTPKPTL